MSPLIASGEAETLGGEPPWTSIVVGRRYANVLCDMERYGPGRSAQHLNRTEQIHGGERLRLVASTACSPTRVNCSNALTGGN